jgi:hypothetical protein
MWAAGIIFYWLLLKRPPNYKEPNDIGNCYVGQIKDVTQYFGKLNLETVNETG